MTHVEQFFRETIGNCSSDQQACFSVSQRFPIRSMQNILSTEKIFPIAVSRKYDCFLPLQWVEIMLNARELHVTGRLNRRVTTRRLSIQRIRSAQNPVLSARTVSCVLVLSSVV